MAISEQELEQIVRSVLAGMQNLKPADQEETGIYDTMQEAIDAAARAQKEVRRMPLEFREKIISNIRKLTIENLQQLAEMGVAETKMGRVGDKIIKHRLVAEKTPGTEDLSTIAWSGDRGLTLVEQGPFGVIGAITPSTKPSETVLCNSIGMLAAGNTVVFNPHPSAIGESHSSVQASTSVIMSAQKKYRSCMCGRKNGTAMLMITAHSSSTRSFSVSRKCQTMSASSTSTSAAARMPTREAACVFGM